jgi:hypothetical protein
MVKVMLRGSFQQSALLSVTLTLTFRSLSIPESQFSKHDGVRPSYWEKATPDCHSPVLTKFRSVVLRRLKNAGKSIWLEKAILQIFKGIVQWILRSVNTKLKKIRPRKLEPARFSFWILKGHHHKRIIKRFSAAYRSIRWLCPVKVMLRRCFQQPAILTVKVTLTFCSQSIP